MSDEFSGEENVRAASAGEEGAGDAGFFECGVELLHLCVRDEVVFGAVDVEEGRIVFGDVGDGGCGCGGVFVGAERAAEEFGKGRAGGFDADDTALVADGEEVGGAAEVEDAGDFGGDAAVFAEVAFEFFRPVAAGGAEQADEVAAR